MDYFGARYYTSSQGRFTSPDVFGVRRRNPQSWNGYLYVINNPLKFNDPLGLAAQDPQDPQDTKNKIDVVRIVIHDKHGLFKRIFGKIAGVFKGGSRLQMEGEEGGEEAESEEAKEEERKADEKDLFERSPWRDPNAIPPVPIEPLIDPEKALDMEEASLVPWLNGETNVERLKDALNRVASSEGSPEAKAKMFERFAAQISLRSPTNWHASFGHGEDGSFIFVGGRQISGTNTVVISPRGEVFVGHAVTGLQLSGTGAIPRYDVLRQIK